MKHLNLNPKSIFKSIFLLFVSLIVVGGIMYILYVTPIVIGIIFVIILALIGGYFGVKIKIALEKKERERDIPGKIEDQIKDKKILGGMKDFEEAMKDPPPKPKVIEPVTEVMGLVKKKVKKTKKVKK